MCVRTHAPTHARSSEAVTEISFSYLLVFPGCFSPYLFFGRYQSLRLRISCIYNKPSVVLRVGKPYFTARVLLHVQGHDHQADPAVGIGRLAHQVLQWRGKGYVGAVKHHVCQHGIAAAREQLRQEAPKSGAEGLRRSCDSRK